MYTKTCKCVDDISLAQIQFKALALGQRQEWTLQSWWERQRSHRVWNRALAQSQEVSAERSQYDGGKLTLQYACPMHLDSDLGETVSILVVHHPKAWATSTSRWHGSSGAIWWPCVYNQFAQLTHVVWQARGGPWWQKLTAESDRAPPLPLLTCASLPSCAWASAY